jgi:AP-4 complex subunit mu-1
VVLLSVVDYRSSSGSGAVMLDDCNFHQSVRLDSFDMDKTLSLVSEVKIM